MDPTYPLVPIANFIACILVLIPLFHMGSRPWNTGVYVFALLSFLATFSIAVNTIVWANDAKDRAPIWCDISKHSVNASVLSEAKSLNEASHIQVLVNTGTPACSFVITRRLYKITRLQGPMVGRRQESSFITNMCLSKPINTTEAYGATTGISNLCRNTYRCHGSL